MADQTKIEWTDSTWNPITGCSIVSPGCTNCYAMALAGTRLKNHDSRKGLTKEVNGKHVWTGEVRLNAQWLDQPVRWTKPRMIFVCAHGDLFAEGVPDEWIDQVFAVMALCPQHTFQVLTKRPERMRDYLAAIVDTFHASPEGMDQRFGEICVDLTASPCAAGKFEEVNWPLPNVWLGVSVEDQRRADERIPILLDTPAAIRWISAEPLLGPVDLRAHLPDSWKIKASRRDWGNFHWPSWVPESVRLQVEDFWRTDYGRGPDAWLRSAHENGQPPLGTIGSFLRLTAKISTVEGRFVPAWNNIGRVITDDGSIVCVSAGRYQSRPARIDWVVVGGESGPHARPMHPDWARALRDQCAAAGVPFLFKQWGEWVEACPDVREADGSHMEVDPNSEEGKALYDPKTDRLIAIDGQLFTPETLPNDTPARLVERVGKRRAGRLLDGVEHNAFPTTPQREEAN